MRRCLMPLGIIAFLIIMAIPGPRPALADGAIMEGAQNLEAEAVRTDLPADIMAWLALMPELDKAPAPTWLKVGARITYHVISAAREGDTSPAGESLVQYDVVSMDAATVLAAAGVHVIGGGGLGTVRDTGFVVGVPGVGDVWMAPSALAKAEKYTNKDISITHTSTNVNGVATKAVRFEYIQGTTRSVNMFDEAKGVLLYRIQASGNNDTAKQSSIVSEFVSMRQLPPAWTGGVTPAWAAVDVVLKYEGTMTVNVGYGAPGPPLALVMLCRITNTAPVGVCVKWETYLSGMKTEERYSLYSAAIPSGGIFLPQAALASLKAGKLLDTDPVTGINVSVAQSFMNVGGKQLLVIIHEGRAFKRLFGYDRQTGMLSYFSESSQDGVAVVQLELKLTSVSN